MSEPRPSRMGATLPRPRTGLIGRADDVTAVRALVSEHRLVTLTGAGGSGKTRLAVAVADAVSGDHRDGAAFVALEDAADEAAVVSTLARSLGIREHPDRDPLENVTRWLKRREILLVIDNFEQVLAASGVVTAVLDETPGVGIIVTSRAPLRIAGEHEFVVEPLGRDDASALFVERATAVRATYVPDDADLEAVHAIAERLDGLPLAIELAAAQVRLLSPAEILDRIVRRLPVLEGGQRDAPARQRTQQATLDWSHDLLDEPRERLFARLAIFAGGWTIEAAERVCDPTGDLGIPVYEGVTSLAEMNLVRSHPDPDAGSRFDMHRLISEYAAERLGESEGVAVARAHAEWVLDLVETAAPYLETSDLKRWHRALLAEQDNIREALLWSIEQREAAIGQRIAAACWRDWHYRGHVREGSDWLVAVLALPDTTSPSHARATALTALGWLRMWQQISGDAVELFVEAAEIHRALDQGWMTAQAMDHAAQAAFQAEQVDRGRALIHQRWSDYPKTLWEGSIWSESNFLALSEYDGAGGGDVDLVVEALKQSISIVRDLDLLVIEAEIMGGLCFTYGLAGRHAESRRHGRDAVRSWLRLGYLGQLGFHLALLARSEIGLGNVVRAVRLAAAGERQHREIGGRRVAYPSRADPMDTAPSLLLPADHARAVAEGEAMTLDEAVAYALSDRDAVPSGSRARRRDPSALTPREREVLDLLVEGHTDGEIGEALFIGAKTASTHVSNIKGKLGADSRVGIVTIALKRGLAQVDG